MFAIAFSKMFALAVKVDIAHSGKHRQMNRQL
jgi:hypothetical protein